MNIEQVREATTPEEMRSEILRLRHEVSLVRAVMDMADFNGMSAEDRYTILAYHAIKESAKARSMLLDQLQMTTQKHFLVTHP